MLRPAGVCAIWCYGLCSIAPEIDGPLREFYTATVGSYWPPDRRHVDEGYRSLRFPFSEVSFPAHVMQQHWKLEEFGEYLRSWSAVARYQRARETDPVTPFLAGLSRAWGLAPRLVNFPLSCRVGRVA